MLVAAAIALVTVSVAAADPLITSSPSAAIRLTPPARTFSLVATGDVLTESAVMSAAAAFATSAGERFAFAPLFAHVGAIIASADLAICHMEMPIGAPGERPGEYGRSPFGGNLILAPYEIADGLRRTGFDRCSTASNHSNDLGEPGLATTLTALDNVGISHAGTARSLSESAPAILTVNGIRVAHLAYTRFSNTVLPTEPWRVNFAASAGQVAADVNTVRAEGAEVVVVSLHLSKELQPTPDPVDRQFVTDLTALTHIDLIIEHGPHVIQPVEEVNGTWVYWSVGNFTSGMGTAASGKYIDQHTLDELAAAARFTETSPGVFTVEPWPVLLCNEPITRTLYAPITALADPLPPIVRSELEACEGRSTAIVSPLH
jgi:poly-gamma-glutamate synthesis protein (capsule biosynthesis protein)